MLHRAPRLLSVMAAVLLLASADQTPVQVIGLVNRSVELSIQLHLPLPVEEIVWKFTTGSRTVKVVEVGNMSILMYSNQFKNRLTTLSHGRTIILKDLTLRDAGKYCAEIILISKEIHRTAFILTVYEPVPSPTIWSKLNENTREQCNFTLHCSVPSITSDVFYTWKNSRRNSAYQRIDNNGSTIQISLLPNHLDMEIMCIVQNHADQKNVSVQLGPFCAVPNNAGTNSTHERGCYMSLRSSLTGAFLSVSLFFICLAHCYR
ncbi:SLAM family member 9-like [Bufo bufo]|uniref:SLAM family member 9-like n=1 Tax=Bufo bufo TaxID=8384 RepID=UPI001ABE142F|nr:SLAM family member 9-like [Bufo bufo]